MQVYSEDWCRILPEWFFSFVLWLRNYSVDFVPWCFSFCCYDFWFCKTAVLVSHPACFSSCCLEFHYDDHAGYVCIRFIPVIAISCCSLYQQCKWKNNMQETNRFQIRTKMFFRFSCETLQNAPPLYLLIIALMNDFYDTKTYDFL